MCDCVSRKHIQLQPEVGRLSKKLFISSTAFECPKDTGACASLSDAAFHLSSAVVLLSPSSLCFTINTAIDSATTAASAKAADLVIAKQ